MKEAISEILTVAKQLIEKESLRTAETKPILEDVKAIVKKESWFEIEEEGRNKLVCSTRNHGDVGEEEPGMEDIRMAKRVGKLLLDKFGSNNLRVEFESIDEWVYLNVTIK